MGTQGKPPAEAVSAAQAAGCTGPITDPLAPPASSLEEQVERLVWERENEGIATQLRIAIRIMLAAVPAYVLADHYLQQPNLHLLYQLKAAGVLLALFVLWAVGRPGGRARVRALGLFTIANVSVLSAASAMLTDDRVAHPLFALLLALWAGALVPWGAREQTAAVSLTVAATALLVIALEETVWALIDYPLILGAGASCGTIYLAHFLHRGRVELARADLRRVQAEEALNARAHTAAALARAGEELLRATEASDLLSRLCRLTTEVLDCDCSYVIAPVGNGKVWSPRAHHGLPAEAGAAVELLELREESLQPLIATLAEAGVVCSRGPRSPAHPLSQYQDRLGVRSRMYALLGRSTDVFGILSAGSFYGEREFSEEQKEVLRRLAVLASMALQTARVLEELARANDFKSEFVANMSHELRTPLNVIIGYHDLILEGAFGPIRPEQADALRRADSSARELLDLINATLDLSRFEAERVPVVLREVDVRELLGEVARDVAHVRTKPGVELRLLVQENAGRAITDVVKARMVLKNLLHNAIKFTEHGSVVAEATRCDGGVCFRVSDTGIGIPEAARDRIFEPFEQADSSISDRFGGTGLGLYIVRRLVEILGGRVRVESEVGVGSTFTVWLPHGAPQPGPSVAEREASGTVRTLDQAGGVARQPPPDAPRALPRFS